MGEKKGGEDFFWKKKKGAMTFFGGKKGGRIVFLLENLILIFLKSQFLRQKTIILEKGDCQVFAGI